MALGAHDQIIRELMNEFKDAPGKSVQERTDYVLVHRGWDKQLAKIKDDEFRTVIRSSLERLALRHEPPQTAREIEKARQQKETERLAALGALGDLFKDQYVGLDPADLAARLPRESYWVPSLDKHVPRDELAFELGAVAELRAQTHTALLKVEQIANVYRHELAIFDELLRQGLSKRHAASMLEGVDQ